MAQYLRPMSLAAMIGATTALTASANAATLATSANAPTPRFGDIAQLTSGQATSGSFNYATNNGPNDNATVPPGQTFTTGANFLGYSLDAVVIQIADPGAVNSNTTYSIQIDKLLNNSTFASIHEETASGVTPLNDDYLTFDLKHPPYLLPNTTYAYNISTGDSYVSPAITAGDSLADGAAALFNRNDGTITYDPDGGDATFVAQLTSHIPEPASLALVGVGGLALLDRKSRRK